MTKNIIKSSPRAFITVIKGSKTRKFTSVSAARKFAGSAKAVTVIITN